VLRKEEKKEEGEKEGEEKYEENKTNFEGAYLRNGLVDLAQIWKWRCSTPREICTNFFLCVSAQGVSSYRCVKTAFSLLL